MNRSETMNRTLDLGQRFDANDAAPSANSFGTLSAKVRDRTALVGIIGLGYVGLPLARAFSARGFPVLGFDIDDVKIEKLQCGESYIGHIGADIIREMRANRFDATSSFERLREVDVVIICVPTPLTETRDPDLT